MGFTDEEHAYVAEHMAEITELGALHKQLANPEAALKTREPPDYDRIESIRLDIFRKTQDLNEYIDRTGVLSPATPGGRRATDGGRTPDEVRKFWSEWVFDYIRYKQAKIRN